MARLAALDENSQRHPGYKRAHTLLNNTFRKEIWRKCCRPPLG